MFGIINVLFLKIDFIHAIYEKLTENFKMFWKTIIFYDSMTANGNKLRNLKEKHETADTYLFLDIDKTLIKTIYANKNQ